MSNLVPRECRSLARPPD